MSVRCPLGLAIPFHGALNADLAALRLAHALFREPEPLQAFARLDIPILYMVGDRSPESAQAVARILIPSLPRVKTVRFPELGHMAPVTHPEPINAAIALFLSEV